MGLKKISLSSNNEITINFIIPV